MRVCIPSFLPGGLNASVSEHFGHCEVFTLADIENGEIVKAWPLLNDDDDGQEHNCAIPVQKIMNEGVKHMIVGGIGRGPLMGFQQIKIDVYTGATGTVEDTLKAYTKGSLNLADLDGACKGGCH